MPPAPQPFATCKWTRVAPPPPPTLHDLQMDKGCGPPTLHDLGAASKGWGPPLQMDKVAPPNLANGQGLGASLGAPPTPICKWTRLGPNPSPLPPQPFTTCKLPHPSRLAKWTRVGGPPTLHDLTRLGPPSTFSRFGVTPQINFTASTYVSKPTRRLVRSYDRALRPIPQRKPQIVFGQALGPPNHRTLEHIFQGTGSVSTDRNINDKLFVPECTLEQALNFA